MHGWLPTAHPVAPAPASAVLSGVYKAGVLGIIRSVYYEPVRYDQRHMGSVYMDHPVCSDNLYGLYDGL